MLIDDYNILNNDPNPVNHINNEDYNAKMEEKLKESAALELLEIEDADEDIFAGEYEEFREKAYSKDFGYDNLSVDVNLSSEIKSRRPQLFKIIITRPKALFELPVSFNDKAPGEEPTGANSDIKPTWRQSDYPVAERAILEIGLQTANESAQKGYQVPKMRVKQSYTQVEKGMSDIIKQFEKKANYYLTNPTKLYEIENFLRGVRPKMEEALQSNETIDIFQNDFDLDRTTQAKTEEDKKEKQVELRTFRDNDSAGQKSKKEKSVNYIRFIKENEVYLAHSLLRNLTFEERIKIIGVPCQTKILFWNFKDIEINSPVFFLDVPMELTCFEFCPTDSDKLVCGLYSGQIILYEFNNKIGNGLLSLLNRGSDSESVLAQKKR